MINLDEAINFYKRQTEALYKAIPCDGCPFDKCKEEHRQLVKWLKELKAYKDARVGCEYCKYNFREQHERPCSLCKRNFMDMFESEVNTDECNL